MKEFIVHCDKVLSAISGSQSTATLESSSGLACTDFLSWLFYYYFLSLVQYLLVDLQI